MNEEYKIHYSYLDDLLRLQSFAADVYEHTGVLGAIREYFIIQQLKSKIDNLLIHGGQVVANGHNAGQTDIIIRKSGTLNPEHGGQVRIVASECAAVLEIKSNAVGTDFRNFNIKAGLIKAENPDVKCGLICYKFRGMKKNILRKFGVQYDSEIGNFSVKGDIECDYQNIDFVLCLDDELESFVNNTAKYNYNKFFFVHKNGINALYNYIPSPPFSYYFLLEIKNAFSLR